MTCPLTLHVLMAVLFSMMTDVCLLSSLMTDRMRAEPQGDPSRSQSSRQGYCGYCRVLYRNLEQVQRPELSCPVVMRVS